MRGKGGKSKPGKGGKDAPSSPAAATPSGTQATSNNPPAAAGGGDDDGDDIVIGKEATVFSKGGTKKVTQADFDLLKVIGKGSFGKVMLVRKKDDGAVYAMKVLRKDAIIKRRQVAHTQAERDILTKMKHPFIVNLNYAFQTKDKLFMILDFVNGGELFFHLKNEGRFSENRVKLYVAEIAAAMEHCHSVGVVYRDIVRTVSFLPLLVLALTTFFFRNPRTFYWIVMDILSSPTLVYASKLTMAEPRLFGEYLFFFCFFPPPISHMMMNFQWNPRVFGTRGTQGTDSRNAG